MQYRRGWGYVYLLHSQGVYKIGSTTKLENRLASYRCHNPYFELLSHYFVPDALSLELHLHELMKDKRMSGREWFTLNTSDISTVKELCDNVVEAQRFMVWKPENKTTDYFGVL